MSNTHTLPAGLGYLLPSVAPCDRRSTIMHAAELVDVPYPPSRLGHTDYPGGTFPYPKFTALCGVRGWGEGSGPVTCKRCLASLARREQASAK